MHYIYGPVKSRRLGLSLGLTVTPYKYCSLDCIYCQLNKTSHFTLERREYVKAESILSELAEFFKNYKGSHIDYVTISGSGEPLLNSKIKDIILGIRRITSIPIVLITNSVLLSLSQVREEIQGADLILPSLDAVTQDIFDKMDRPFTPKIKIEEVISGLIDLKKEFKGKIWLEIMLVRGINDNLEYIKKIKEVILKINPDKIQLNVPSRPPAEVWVKIPTMAKLKKIQSILGNNCEII